MTSGLPVRRFNATDTEACLEIFDGNVPDYFREGERSEFVDFLNRLPGPYLVLETKDGAVVACGGVARSADGTRADLCWGMVRREEHGRGWGRRLTEARIGMARAMDGVTEMACSTTQHTEGFYARFGFRTVHTEEDGYGPGLDRLDMRMLLSAGVPNGDRG